jgi:PAS domain S-box-containing protein
MISEQDFQRFFRATPTAILLVDRGGLVVESNPAASGLFGRSLASIVGVPILRWIAEEDRDRSKGHFAQALRGRTVEWSTRLIRGNGSHRGVLFRVLPFSREGEDDRLVAFVQPAEVEGDDRSEAVQIQNLLENLPGQFVVILDMGGRIRYSGGMARSLWYDDESQVGREFEALLGDRAGNHQRYESSRRETAAGQQWDGELWLTRADGSTIPVRVYAVPYRGSRTNAITGTLIVGRDASQEQAAREIFERTKRFSGIGELVVSIAHELGKPVARLGTLAAQIAQAQPDSSGPESKLGVEVAHLDRLLSSLLTFSREDVMARVPVSVEQLLAESVAEQRYLLTEGGIDLTLSVMPALPQAFLDARHMILVLRAVLENAREALADQPGGRILVEAVATGAGVVIRVRDNARSTAVDWVEHGFGPFFTTKPGHLGLGLPLARGIMAEHGGQIWAERSAAGWTTITIELPSEPPAEAIVFRPVPLVLGRSRPILVVDDDSSVRSVLRKLLERVGYRVTEGWSGRSALAQITSGAPPELVVTGLRMHDGSGHWFLDQLAKDFPSILRRTVIVTADPSQVAGGELAEATGCPVLRKPVDFQLLLETLDEVALRH